MPPALPEVCYVYVDHVETCPLGSPHPRGRCEPDDRDISEFDNRAGAPAGFRDGGELVRLDVFGVPGAASPARRACHVLEPGSSLVVDEP